MFTYKWADLIELVKKQVKGIPTQPIDTIQCDWVSTLIAEKLPWKPLQQTIARGQIPLIDNQQDYDPPFNMWKLSEASLRLTSVTPGEDISLKILDSLPRDPLRRSVYAITSIALQAGVGKLRLLSAVAIPVNQTWELRGQYEINPTKVISLNQGLWFDDKYVHLAIEGLKYCYFQMADDPRAGSVSATGLGDSQYTGQIATFVSALKRMADAETRNLDQQVMPESPLGIASRQYGAMIAGYGFGFGGGTGVQQQGLVAINNDTTPMQYLVSGVGISITSVGIGYTMISALDGGGGGGAIQGAFVDDETVAGSGTSFTLAQTPNPPASLELFQSIPGFGSVLLRQGIDYTISGTQITTVNTIAAGDLVVWYRAEPAAPAAGLGALAISPGSVIGGGTSSGMVTLTAAAPAGGALITLLSSDPSVAQVPAFVVVAEGTTSATFTVTTSVVSANTSVTISGNYGAVTKSAGLMVTIPAAVVPTVTSVLPNTGPANTQTNVTITGTNFAAGATVTFGGTPATNIVVVSATQITCIAPSRAAGLVAVAVTVSGQTGTQNNAFTYQAPAVPIYGGVGAAGGDAPVNVSGTNAILSNMVSLPKLLDRAEIAGPVGTGDVFGPFYPNNECIYLLLIGASHTFVDQNGNGIGFNPPISVMAGGNAMYLYASEFALFSFPSWSIRVAT